jgi:hypothetical protein
MNENRVQRSGRQQRRWRRSGLRGAVTALAGLAGGAALVVSASAAAAGTHAAGSAHAAVAAGDSPAGFWYGTDSHEMPVTGSGPFNEPTIGGGYGGYIGMLGNWSHWVGCRGIVVWSSTNSQQANTNLTKYHKGIGTGAYWFMAGPGVDPHYNGTTAEATSWGAVQAKRALTDLKTSTVKYPVLFMDIEIPGDAPDYTPAPDNGWNSVYTSSCSGVVKATSIPAAVDRADFNGFFDYVTAHSSYTPGVYSAPSIWASIFGTGSAASIPHTREWTYNGDTSSLSRLPSGWCLTGTATCAQWFGGVTATSSSAVMWQWSGGGGTDNGVGDFDQIDASRTP